MDPSLDQKLRETLFPCGDEANTYAVIDGASCDDLLKQLRKLAPENCCLYAGELEVDMKEVAPYLVHLKEDHPFTEWLLTNFIGKSWCIFARSPASFPALRKHFRTFLLVKSAEGEVLYFRYYDPRVLRIYLPTTNEEECNTVFGPIAKYYCETPTKDFMQYRHINGQIQIARPFKVPTLSNAS